MRNWTEVYTIGDLLGRAVERFTDRDALVFPTGRQTYGQLDRAATEHARSLVAMGIGSGDHVGILMPNCPEYAEVLLACTLIGAWAVPINSRYKSLELAYVVENADLVALVTTDVIDEFVDFVGLLNQALPSLAEAGDPHALRLTEAPMLRSIVSLGEKSPHGMLDRAAFRALGEGVDVDEVNRRRSRVAVRDVAIMMYTSGTTANPKGCPLTHEAVVRPALEAGRTRFELQATDRVWDPLPMFHMSFVLPFLACMDAGAALLSMERFEPGEALRYMREERATVNFASFPTLAQAFLSHPDYRSEDLYFRIINLVAPPDLLRSIQAAMPNARQISAYGLTEAGGVSAFGEPDDTDEQRATTSGRPFRGVEVAVRDPETNEPVATGERGELVLRGYCLFEGYYKDPVKNAEAVDAAGWLHTGDLGRIDSEGRITYVGRVKDMLKVGGENVAATEIESYLQTHPSVLLAQVVSAPDAKYGEVPAAFVQVRPGATVDAEELISFCTEKISSFKVPRYVRFVDSWPMSATKVQKYRLRDQLAAELRSL